MEDESTADSSSQLYTHNYVEIEEILNRILYKPIRVQLDLVNKSVISFFFYDLKLDANLAAIRQYILFENGTFSQCFVDEIFASLMSVSTCYLSPVHLNDALNKAVAQVAKTCPYVANLGIRIVPVRKSHQASHRQTLDESNILMRNLDRIQLIYKYGIIFYDFADKAFLISVN